MSICTWIFNHFKSEYKFSPTDILFGIPCKNDVYLLTVNYMILTGKMYIYKCKLDGRTPFLLDYLKDLNACVEIETYGLVIINDKGYLRERWSYYKTHCIIFSYC